MKAWRTFNILVFTVAVVRPCSGQCGSLLDNVKSRILLNECRAKTDPKKNFIAATICFKGNIDLGLGIFQKRPENNVMIKNGQSYIGFHISRYISLHTKGRLVKVEAVDNKLSPFARHIQSTESMFIAIGNPTLDRISMTLGRSRLQFGYDRPPIQQLIREIYITDRYWQTPSHSWNLSYQNNRNSIVNLGLSFNNNEQDQPVDQTKAIRIIFDIPALGGTRFIMSGLSKDAKHTRYGAAVINKSKNRTVTALEWVITQPKTSNNIESLPIDKDEGRILRLTILGSDLQDDRMVFLYEDEKNTHWLASFGRDFFINKHTELRTAGTWIKPRIKSTLSGFWDDRYQHAYFDTQWLISFSIRLQI